MMTCTKKFAPVPFAHRQPRHSGHCSYIHGHDWVFEVTFVAVAPDACGFVIDFGRLGPIKEWLSQFDHALVLTKDDPLVSNLAILPDVALKAFNLQLVDDGSCEGLAKLAFHEINRKVKVMTDERVSVRSVTLHEGFSNSATYSE